MIVEKQMECKLAGETKVLGETLSQRHFCPSQNQPRILQTIYVTSLMALLVSTKIERISSAGVHEMDFVITAEWYF
jgi:hypothetical protein